MLNDLKGIIKEKYFESLKIEASREDKKIFIFLAANYGNLGDVAITCAQKKYIESNLKGYKIIEIPVFGVYRYIRDIEKKVNKDDIITIVGGGNIGNLYEGFEKARRYIIKKFKNNRIISFPQSIYFTNNKLGTKSLNKTIKIYSNHNDLHIFAREHVSYEKMQSYFKKNKIYQTPDIVLSLRTDSKNIERNGILLCLRDDKEKSISNEFQEDLKKHILEKYKEDNIKVIDTHIGDDKFNYLKKEKYLTDILNEFKKSKLVVTDRLHGMIFAAITNTPCIVFKNNNGKIINTYYDWLKEFDSIKLIEDDNIETFIKCINEIYDLKNINSTDNLERVYKNFNDIKDVLRG